MPTAAPRLPGSQHPDLPLAGGRNGVGGGAAHSGKKTAEAIQREVAQEVDRLLQVIFADRRKSGRLDLQAVEMVTRAAVHRAGAALLAELLQSSAPRVREIPCPCGGAARYRELRRKQMLTVVGPLEVWRPYYWCSLCHRGQSPQDVELDVAGTACSPGVRRMLALVGSQSSFAQGCQQLEQLAGLPVKIG